MFYLGLMVHAVDYSLYHDVSVFVQIVVLSAASFVMAKGGVMDGLNNLVKFVSGSFHSFLNPVSNLQGSLFGVFRRSLLGNPNVFSAMHNALVGAFALFWVRCVPATFWRWLAQSLARSDG